jgi:hypothetical protein
MIAQWYKDQNDEFTNGLPPAIGGSTPTIYLTLEIPVNRSGKPCHSGEDSSTLDIPILGESAFDDLLTRDRTIKLFDPWME